jgi:Calcineurin-like phosphoesterase
MNSRTFVIPDIHGCELTFRRLLDEVLRFRTTDQLYLLGDTIDRGPRSQGVLDTIRRLQADGCSVTSVRGNHEEMLLKSCIDRNYFHLWMMNGGHDTLKSFGVEDACELPYSYRDLLDSFPYYVELDDFILVHAGLNFAIPEPFTDREAMLWNRERHVAREMIGGKRLIGGHTPQNRDEIRRSLDGDHILLDNGCVYKGEPGLGSLAALELQTMELYFQENIDM